MESGLAGRSALVSRASKGIGKGIGRALAREGVNVALLARTEHEVLAAAQEIASETGVTVVGVQADVTGTNSLKAAVAHLSGLASFNALNIVGRDAVRALADAMIPKWRHATAPRCRVGKRQFERRITFVVPQISA